MYSVLLLKSALLTEVQSDDELEYGLITLWEVLENQAALVEGRESDVFAHLLRLRFRNKINVRPSSP